jgi:hypothetical protein
MSDSDEMPVLARFYKSTVQRIPCQLKLFNSCATFVLACDNIRKIYIWVGLFSSSEDITLAQTGAFNILRDDYLNMGEIVTVKEGMENLHQQNLDSMLDQIIATPEDYIEFAPLRSIFVENSPITLSVVERRRSDKEGVVDEEYTIKPISHSPLGRTGSVLPLDFLSVVSRKTIAILTTGKQYDIW